MSLKQTICYRCLKDGPMPKQYDWICPECTLKDSQRHVITADEKEVLDRAIEFYHLEQERLKDNRYPEDDFPTIKAICELCDAVSKIVVTA